ncbi:MAG: hypothetical protein GEV07_07260 [Streptosporangiales bacterium]|nr:hypothetical protein [Streptosporangiales bacterium]
METDKVGVDLENPADGVISGIAYPAGTEVAAGAVLAWVAAARADEGTDEVPSDQAPQPVTPAPAAEAEVPSPPSQGERTVALPLDRRDWSRPHEASPARRHGGDRTGTG